MKRMRLFWANESVQLGVLAALALVTIPFTAFAMLFLYGATFASQEDVSITKQSCLLLGLMFTALAIPSWVLLLKRMWRGV